MTEKNSRKRNKVKAVILSAALSVSMMFAVTACGSSTDTNTQQAASVQQESSMPDTTIAATQSTTSAATDASSEMADGTYTGTVTSVSDTSITVSVMGAGMQGDPGAGNSAQAPGAGGPSDKAPDGGSGMQPGGDGKGGPKDGAGKGASDQKPGDGAGQGGSGMQPGNGGSMEAPQGQEMTFTVTADQVSGFASGDMVTVTVANGTVSSVEKAQVPEPAADASASE